MAILNPYLSILIDDDLVTRAERTISRLLLELKMPFSFLQSDKHISIGYCLGEVPEEEIEGVMNEVAEAPFVVQAKGLKLLRGQTTNSDYIAIDLQVDDELGYAVEFVADNYPVKTFNGGFNAHVSLFAIPKGIDDELAQDLIESLELHSSDIYARRKIIGKEIVCHREDRRVASKVTLKKAA